PSQLLLLVGLLVWLQTEAEAIARPKPDVTCPYNIIMCPASLKAWQRVRSQVRSETLVLRSTRNSAQAGRYLLEDFPTKAVFKVTMTGLWRQDSGLYQCVIHLSSENTDTSLPQGIWPGHYLLVLMCRFILNKGLVVSVLFVFLWKAGPKVSQPPEVWKAQGIPGQQ
uniref:Ig-like domain-containing protein n=1 Tax=Nannospalax galili TaxID=1026970 RepID=A0A8C6R723_NANGA